jgi:hypothetical protein
VYQALGFLFLYPPQQVIRLIQLYHRITLDDAIKLKSHGGAGIQALRDFTINSDKTYSFKRIAQFSRTRISLVNGWRKELDLTTKIPGKVISDYLKKLILYMDPQTAILYLQRQKTISTSFTSPASSASRTI